MLYECYSIYRRERKAPRTRGPSLQPSHARLPETYQSKVRGKECTGTVYFFYEELQAHNEISSVIQGDADQEQRLWIPGIVRKGGIDQGGSGMEKSDHSSLFLVAGFGHTLPTYIYPYMVILLHNIIHASEILKKNLVRT